MAFEKLPCGSVLFYGLLPASGHILALPAPHFNGGRADFFSYRALFDGQTQVFSDSQVLLHAFPQAMVCTFHLLGVTVESCRDLLQIIPIDERPGQLLLIPRQAG